MSRFLGVRRTPSSHTVASPVREQVTGLPVTCQLCGNHFPDNDAVWDHECPAWQEEVRRSRPRLAVYRNIEQWYEVAAKRDPWRQKLVSWGLRQVFPHKPDADLIDGIERLGTRYARRLEQKLIRRGLAETRERSLVERVRRELETQEQEEAAIVAASKKRRKERENAARRQSPADSQGQAKPEG